MRRSFERLKLRFDGPNKKVDREKTQKSQKTMSAGLSVITSIAGALFGRKLTSVSNVSRAGTAIRSAGSVAKEGEDVKHAQEALQSLVERQQDLNAEVEDAVLKIQDSFDADLMELNQEEVKPRKSDIDVERVVLVWLPYSEDRHGTKERAF